MCIFNLYIHVYIITHMRVYMYIYSNMCVYISINKFVYLYIKYERKTLLSNYNKIVIRLDFKYKVLYLIPRLNA